jgi:hypothetical protein
MISISPQSALGIAALFTGGLGGAIAANWFTTWRDQRVRKHAFRGYVRSILAEIQAIDLEALQEGQLLQKQQATVQALRAECAKVYEDICSASRTKFEEAWVTYCGLTKQDVEPHDRFDPVANPTAILFPNYERGRERIATLLTEILRHAR